MEEILYRKVFIRSEEDLPQSDRKMYFVGVKDNLEPEDVYEWFNYKNPVMADNQAEYWINTFDWYLTPVPIPTEEEIDKEFTRQGVETDYTIGKKYGAKWLLNKITNC